jgi:alkylation response protein AidB-like acyl-CoA dehydrogenase
MAGPTVVTHGDEALKTRLLRPMFTGEEKWCQLFSEPGAGSDLAGLACKAVRDGDEWVITGQKVWNTLAHLADRGMLVARTDPDAPKHKGMTYFALDMHAPGVEVRPLRQITGEAEFNEVYLTEVRVPDADRIGDVGEGWRVAMTTLIERAHHHRWRRWGAGPRVGCHRRGGADLAGGAPRAAHRGGPRPPDGACGSGPRCCGSPTSAPPRTARPATPARRGRSPSSCSPR